MAEAAQHVARGREGQMAVARDGRTRHGGGNSTDNHVLYERSRECAVERGALRIGTVGTGHGAEQAMGVKEFSVRKADAGARN
jgi:hypothetical protein